MSTIWKSKKGDVAISDMATPHIRNSINKVERELTDPSTSNREVLESVLTSLKQEYSTRSDATA